MTLIKSTPWLNNHFFLSTDACASGAGGYFQGQYFHTPFPGLILEQYGHDINILELLAVMAALKLWAPALRGYRFILSCDNKNCVLFLNPGHSRTRAMQLCRRKIWLLSAAAAFDFELAVYSRHLQLPGWPPQSLAYIPGHKAHFDALTFDIPTVHVPCTPDSFNFDVRSWHYDFLLFTQQIKTMPSLAHQPSLRFKNMSRIFKLTPTLLVPSGT